MVDDETFQGWCDAQIAQMLVTSAVLKIVVAAMLRGTNDPFGEAHRIEEYCRDVLDTPGQREQVRQIALQGLSDIFALVRQELAEDERGAGPAH